MIFLVRSGLEPQFPHQKDKTNDLPKLILESLKKVLCLPLEVKRIIVNLNGCKVVEIHFLIKKKGNQENLSLSFNNVKN